jgi:hypothetical protein
VSKSSSAVGRYIGIVFFLVGALLVVVSAGLLARHATEFSGKREHAVEIGSALSIKHSAVTLHAAQFEAERAFVQGALTAREEQAEVYVLPDTSPVPRMVRALDELSRILMKAGSDVRVDRVGFDSAPEDHGTFKSLRGRAVFHGSYQSVARLLGLLSFSGDMMLKDVLPASVQDALLQDIEAAAPLSLRAAQDFLYLDLLQFALDPSRQEDQMFADVPPEAALDMKAFLIEQGTGPLRTTFADIAPAIKASSVWPLPLVRIESVVRNGTDWTVTMVVYMR